jgi:hypothetical protein
VYDALATLRETIAGARESAAPESV